MHVHQKSFLNLCNAHENMKPERIETFTPLSEHLIYEMGIRKRKKWAYFLNLVQPTFMTYS